MKKSSFLQNSITTALVAALFSCGGGSDTNTKVQTPDTGLNDSILQLEDNLSVNQSVDLILYFPNDELSNIQWQQTSGEQVTIHASTSKAIGFTPTSAGTYTFEVSFNKNGQATQSISKSITINNESNLITTRLAHEVISGNKVSLRAHPNTTIDKNLIRWQQVAGPEVTLTETELTGELAIFFNAPKVNNDTYLSFEASATIEGITYSDQVTILVEPANNIDDDAYFDSPVAKVFPYSNNSPYKNYLSNCVYSNSLTSSCTFAKLPLIAQEVDTSSPTPSVDTIMDRVVVSHQWMGDRFKDFLLNNDPHDDFKNLLRATTAIVISYDIRPSFYWAATGAIYLDADNFWLTAQERDTINEAPDYRADFGNDLQFVMPWRYVKNNAYASSYIPADVRIDRSASFGLYRLTSLMYHELAHANDFFPSNEWSIHSSQTRVLDAALNSDFESDQLAQALPLQSNIMRDLAKVSFAGEKANTMQKSYLPKDIEVFFSADFATDFYAYSSLREDYAMLFEELMMHNRYNIDRDVAITNQPNGDNVSAKDYMVTWGQRGRIGEESIKERVLFSASRVLPEFDSATALLNLPSPIEMTRGADWIENLTISPVSLQSKGAKAFNNSSFEQNQLPITYHYHHKNLPKH